MGEKITDYPSASSIAVGDFLDVSKEISTNPSVYQSQKAPAALLADWNLFGQNQTLPAARTHNLNNLAFGLVGGDIGLGDSVSVVTTSGLVSDSFKVISNLGNSLLHVSNTNENTGIGTNTPATSAILELNANDKGFLKPRLTTTERDNNILSPATGLEIYNLTTQQDEFYNGSAWVVSSSNIMNTNGLTLLGNYTHDFGANKLTFDGSGAASNDVFEVLGQFSSFQTYAHFDNRAALEIAANTTEGAIRVKDQLFGSGTTFKVNSDLGGFWKGTVTLGENGSGIGGLHITTGPDYEFRNASDVREIFFDLAIGTQQVRFLENGYARASGSAIFGGNTAISTEDFTVYGDAVICDALGDLGFYGTTPQPKQTITGSRGGNAALADLLTKLDLLGIITDSTTA